MKDKEGRQYATINLSNYRYFNLSRNFYTFRHVVTLADGSDDTNLVKPDFTCTNDYFGVIPATNGYAVVPIFSIKRWPGQRISRIKTIIMPNHIVKMQVIISRVC